MKFYFSKSDHGNYSMFRLYWTNEDAESDVQCGVISNSNTPTSLLENFLKDEDKETRGYAKDWLKARK